MKTSLERLSESRSRITSCRVYILHAFAQMPQRRMRVEDIYRALNQLDTPVSLGSIYRVLRELTADGILRRTWDKIGGEPRYRYQMASDEDTADASRMTCSVCAEHVLLDNPELTTAILQAGRDVGMDAAGVSVNIQVTCSRCSETQVKATPPAVQTEPGPTAKTGRKKIN